MRIAWNASSVLIGLGLVLGLAALTSGLVDAQRNASPFDQVDAPDAAGLGFEPMRVPATALGATRVAPTMLPLASHQPAEGLVTVVPASTARVGLEPALDEGPAPTATAERIWQPDRLVIPAIELDVAVVPSTLKEVATWGEVYQQWVAPDKKASGWHTTSAPLGVPGNTVLNGHHNIRGEVFGHLADLEDGDLVWVYAGARAFVYRIALVTTLPERWQTMEVRLTNAQWIEPSTDERLTLVTCWPYASNTHRLVIVALPVNLAAIEGYEMTPRLTPHPPAN